MREIDEMRMLGVAFLMFMAACVIGMMLADYYKHQEKMAAIAATQQAER